MNRPNLEQPHDSFSDDEANAFFEGAALDAQNEADMAERFREISLEIDQLIARYGLDCLVDASGETHVEKVDDEIARLTQEGIDRSESVEQAGNNAALLVHGRIAKEITLFAQINMLKYFEQSPDFIPGSNDKPKGRIIAQWLSTNDHELESPWGRFLNEAIPGQAVDEDSLYVFMAEYMNELEKTRLQEAEKIKLTRSALDGGSQMSEELIYKITTKVFVLAAGKTALSEAEFLSRADELARQFGLESSAVLRLVDEFKKRMS